jgi:hypothetical protein
LDDLPPLTPGFRQLAGKRGPPKGDKRYHIQLRQGFADMNNTYTRDQLVWIWDGSAGDIVAVMDAEQPKAAKAAWTPTSGGY